MTPEESRRDESARWLAQAQKDLHPVTVPIRPAQIPNAQAMVLHHSMKTIFCASRVRHQESGRKNSSGAAATRMAGPPPSARNAAR